MELNNKIYTIQDFFNNKDKIYKHCLVLNREDKQKADYLFGETAIRLSEIIKDRTFPSDNRFLFFCGKVASNISKEIKRENKNMLYLEDIFNNENNDEEDAVSFEIPVTHHFFDSFESNIDIYYATKSLTYLEKKIVHHLYNGYSREEIAYKYKININTINTLLNRFDGVKFKVKKKSPQKRTDVKSNSVVKFEDKVQILKLIDNKKHKGIYDRYLSNQSLDSIAKSYGTTRGSIGVTIKRINDKLKKEGVYVNKRGQGGGSKVGRKVK